MRVTNFLPDDYLQQRGLRRTNWMCVGIAAGTLVLIGAMVAFVLVRSWGVAGMRLLTDAQYAQASRQIEDLNQLEARKLDLLHKVELSTALLERVPRSHVLARLANHLPEYTSLTSMTMQLEETKVKVAEPADGAAGGKKAQGVRGKNQPRIVHITRLRFRLDGLAETDVQVAEYMSRLHTDPLFDAVDLQFSEEFPYQEGVTMRRFQMSLLLSEDADKVLESVGEESAGVADSSPTGAKGNS